MRWILGIVSACLIAGVCQAFTITPGQEFAANSYVYKPLANNAPLDPDNDRLVAGLNAQLGIKMVNTYLYGNRIFIAPPGAPTQTVLNAMTQDWTGTGHANPPICDTAFGLFAPYDPYPPLQDEFSSVPVPDNFEQNGGTDESANIYQPSTGTYWEFFLTDKVRRPIGASCASFTIDTVPRSDGALVEQWFTAWGGRMTNIATNPGIWLPPPDGWGRGQNAVGLPQIAGGLGIEEQQRGVIDHVVFFGIPNGAFDCVRQNLMFAWPAQRSDGTSCYNGPNPAVPLGTRFRLPADLNLDAMDMDPYARMIAKAVQKHGLLISDTTSMVFRTGSFVAETPGTALYGTPNDPYFPTTGGGIGGCPPWDSQGGTLEPPTVCRLDSENRLRGFPWTQLQALKNCYFDHYDVTGRAIYVDNCDASLP